MTKELEDRVSKIIDEGLGRSRRVIIQMKYLSATAREWLTAAARTGRHRAMNLNPRSILPAPANSYERMKGTLPDEQRRRLVAAQLSLSANIAISKGAVRIRRPSKRSFRAASAASLGPLERNSVIQKVRASNVGAASTRTFWTAGAMAMELKKDDLARIVREVEEVADVFPNYTVSLPSVGETMTLSQQTDDNRTSSWGVEAIGAMSVWGAYRKRGRGSTIAVLDTGVDPTHPDLTGKLAAFSEFDANGAMVNNPVVRDSGRHGTHVAGTVVGGRAGGRWIGVAPDARVAVALVLPNGSGSIAQILAGMEWAIDQRVDVINMSLGDIGFSPEVVSTYTRTVITAAQFGIPVVAAVGNDGSQTSGAPGNDFFAFAVGATDSNDRVAGFSGGRSHIITRSKFIDPNVLPLVFQKPNVCAPGVAVRSAVPGGGYQSLNGSSMAAPHVAGAMALLLSATDLANKVAVSERAFVMQDLMSGSVRELGETGQDHRYGWGRVDVLRAIGNARELGF